MRNYEEVWRFETARFTIVGEVTDEEMSPEEQFSDRRDVEAIRNGEVQWFCARVRVLLDGQEVGSDHLGGCAYHRPLDLFRDHARGIERLRYLRGRTDRKSKNERKRLREMVANNRLLKPPYIIGFYGPDMVREACRDARKTLARLGSVKLRAA